MFSEKYAVIGTLLLVAVAVYYYFAKPRTSMATSARTSWAIIWLAASGLVVMFQTQSHSGSGSIVLMGAATDVLTVGAVALIARRSGGAELLLKTFIALMMLVAASYAVTLALWLSTDIFSWIVTDIDGPYGYPLTMRMPFTVTASSQDVFGLRLPRLTGFAREPGLMALYAGLGFILLRYTGWRIPLARPLLLLALLGTVSTGGFAVFVVAIALDYFLSAARKHGLRRFGRRAVGAALIVGGSWAAFFAPVVGFASKEEQNAISLDLRT